MKALSVRQPWALAIANGVKTVECRSWRTPYRGRLLVCASGRPLRDDDGLVLPAGVAVAVVTLTDIRRMTEADLYAACLEHLDPPDVADILKGYAWHINLEYPVLPVPVKGKLHLFDVDAEVQKLPSEYYSYHEYLHKTQGIPVPPDFYQ